MSPLERAPSTEAISGRINAHGKAEAPIPPAKDTELEELMSGLRCKPKQVNLLPIPEWKRQIHSPPPHPPSLLAGTPQCIVQLVGRVEGIS